jgi:hypothetical protein
VRRPANTRHRRWSRRTRALAPPRGAAVERFLADLPQDQDVLVNA